MSTLTDLVSAALDGDRGALARLLSIAERGGDDARGIERLITPHTGKALIIGVTGPPGAGKSTLISALLSAARETHGRIAVLAVDPSSPFSHGALLGDRVRMQGRDFGQDVFIRSMASRGETGGLARATATGTRLFDAGGWPVVIIETLGIGQVDLEVTDLADIVVVVLTPGWGDTIQANKAGLTEAGDIFVINKSDKPGAEQTAKDLTESLSLLRRKPQPRVLQSIATRDERIDKLWQSILEEYERLVDAGELERHRNRRHRNMIRKMLRSRLEEIVGEVMESEATDALLQDAASGKLDIRSAADKLVAIYRGHKN